MTSAKRLRVQFRLRTLLLLQVAVAALLVGLPSLQAWREAQRRAQCTNNLFQWSGAEPPFESLVAGLAHPDPKVREGSARVLKHLYPPDRPVFRWELEHLWEPEPYAADLWDELRFPSAKGPANYYSYPRPAPRTVNPGPEVLPWDYSSFRIP